MKSKLCILAVAAMAAFATPVFADVVDDAIVLAQSGVSDEVIVAWSQHQHMGALSAQGILRLRSAKVPDRAIAAMIQASQAPSESVNAGYVQTTPSTTTSYDYPTTYYYSDGYPYYYSYGYPYYYGGYPYYGYGWGPSFGLSFDFGGHRSFRGGGFRSGSGSGFTSGGSRSFSSGGSRSFSSGGHRR